MKVGDLVVDRLGMCGLVVREGKDKFWVSYLVLFGDRQSWCSKYEFRVVCES